MKKYDNKWLEDFLIRNIWTTNAIEGNWLSLTQTKSIIINNTISTISGKFIEIRLHDIKEVENGEKAFNTMFYYLEKKKPINEELIKVFQYEITKNLIDKPGQWKVYENQVRGSSFKTVSAAEIPKAINELLNWYHKELLQTKNLIKLFADFHVKFEAIHPFEDGNGRTGRLLLNYQLMSFNYFPICFPLIKEYLNFLVESQVGKQNWKEIEASENFTKLIENLSQIEKERELKLTQEHYTKKEDNEKE